ncbi:MAG TPA: CDP-alcohol phosphatidyltransferase family protein [Actinomycetota bacterium]|nr:CDP-alcohol phosphatidyltransferase family protein [Actinomycetota bacterium]
MGIYAIKPRFRAGLTGVADYLGRRGATPDQITTVGIVASLGAAGCFLGSHSTELWLLLVPVLAFVRTAANALDGLVAERTNSGRPAGELYNEIADRIGDTAFIAGTALVPNVPLALSLGALAAALLSSFIGIAAKGAGGSRRYDGPMGKPDRMAVIGLGSIVAFFTDNSAIEWALGVIAVGAVITALNRYRKAKEELERAG